MRKTTLSLVAVSVLFLFGLSSCTQRLIDFTMISSKNVAVDFPDRGERVVGNSIMFLGIGVNIKDALDEAIEEAGPQYDALIDGVLSYKQYPFVYGYEVEGTPVNTSKAKAEMGEEKFEKWAKNHDIEYHSSKESDKAEKPEEETAEESKN